MPRYFFNVVDGREIRDTEGSELIGRAEIRAVALATAAALLRGVNAPNLWIGELWKLVVTDKKGFEVLILSFSAHEPPYAFHANDG